MISYFFIHLIISKTMKFLLISLLFTIFQPNHEAKQDLIINVTNIEAVKGSVGIAIYNKKEAFPKDNQHYKKYYFKVTKSSMTYKIKDLPKGEYGIAIYHDKNSDKKCNLNFFGIPTEGYGFSRNFVPKISAPSFKQVKFSFPKTKKLTIKMIN